MLAYIIPLETGGVPTPPIYYPPSIWPQPGHPAHPIAPGGGPSHPWVPPIDPGFGQPTPPDMIWGGRPPAGYPMPPMAPGGGPSHPWVPGPPNFPSQGPGFPTPPIAWPGPPGGSPPNVVWPPAGVPTPPIYYPPAAPSAPEFPIGGEGWKLRYLEGYGWVLVPPADWTPDKPTGEAPVVTPH